ncbi:MAG: hypothetical protein WCP79_11950 [Bacillota bacterium]
MFSSETTSLFPSANQNIHEEDMFLRNQEYQNKIDDLEAEKSKLATMYAKAAAIHKDEMKAICDTYEIKLEQQFEKINSNLDDQSRLEKQPSAAEEETSKKGKSTLSQQTDTHKNELAAIFDEQENKLNEYIQEIERKWLISQEENLRNYNQTCDTAENKIKILTDTAVEDLKNTVLKQVVDEHIFKNIIHVTRALTDATTAMRQLGAIKEQFVIEVKNQLKLNILDANKIANEVKIVLENQNIIIQNDNNLYLNTMVKNFKEMADRKLTNISKRQEHKYSKYQQYEIWIWRGCVVVGFLYFATSFAR